MSPLPDTLRSGKPLLRKADDGSEPVDESRISAYARLDFDNYTFFVQTLQVVLGRKSHNELLQASHHTVDVHLSSKKAVSRRHAKIFYNFGTQRFEISVLGRNGAFVDDAFIEKGTTIALHDRTKLQIGDIAFRFVLPAADTDPARRSPAAQPFNPADALNLRTNMYQKSVSPPRAAEKKGRRGSKADIVRRLSLARRKSHAAPLNDDISALLRELDACKDDDDDAAAAGADAALDPALFASDRALAHDQLQREEDEIDALVKQHNLHEGVVVPDDKPPKDLAMDISMLDQEMATLAPLLDAHAHADDRRRADARPLMGKPAAPRMGKPATIQPPGSRLYRAGPPAAPFAAPYTAAPYAAAPYTAAAYTGAAYAAAPYASTGGYAPYAGYAYSAAMRPPAPKLEVAVETIVHVAAVPSVAPYKPITVDGEAMERPPVCTFKRAGGGGAAVAVKIPLRRKDPGARRPAKVQNLRDIPEPYKTKPTVSISAMISAALRVSAAKPGFTLYEIHENIRELFPYYKYCPDGWQFTVTHNVRFNKLFTAVSKPLLESEWLWAVDEAYIAEKEKTRKKQQEAAMAKAKEAALRAVDYRSRNMTPYRAMGRPFSPDFARYPAPTPGLQKPRSIAEIASEIKREGAKTAYFHGAEPAAPARADAPDSIKEQLAANRARPKEPVMNTDTKKSLAYLQKELFTLYKARKLSYNTTVTTEIITKALATTIAQVNTIGAKAGCGDNALVFLVEKAPQQVSKILDIALTKSIKEQKAAPGTQSPGKSPATNPATPTPGTPGTPNPGASAGASAAATAANPATPGAAPTSTAALGKPPSFGARPAFAGLSKPPGFSKPGLAKPPQFLSNKARAEKRPAEDSEPGKKVLKSEESQ